MQMPLKENMSIVERERFLWQISRQYIDGEITLEELDEYRSELFPMLFSSSTGHTAFSSSHDKENNKDSK